MLLRRALQTVSQIAADQWGLITTRQALGQGMSALDMSRLATDGLLVRVRHGVYRVSATPPHSLDGLRAEWLALKPGVTALERIAFPTAGAVVSGPTAAWIRDLGVVSGLPYEFALPYRRQTSQSQVMLRMRAYRPEEVEIVAGLPVTTVQRTIADLLFDRLDLDQVRQIVEDCRPGIFSPATLSAMIPTLARRYGITRGALTREIDSWHYES